MQLSYAAAPATDNASAASAPTDRPTVCTLSNKNENSVSKAQLH